MKRILMLLAGLVAFGSFAAAQVSFPSLNNAPWLGQELLGRVAADSVTVNVVLDQPMQVYFEYGTASGTYTSRTATLTTSANTPLNVLLDKLQPNTRYYYRMQYALSGGSTFIARPEHSFVTQRPRGTPFTFVVQADPHMDDNTNSDVYKLTLLNELSDKPDFMIDLGDTMMTDKLSAQGIPVNGGSSPTAAGVLSRTQLLRSYYDLATHSVPLFLALGNHEGEWGTHLNGTANNFAVWDTQDRTAYFPNPAPDNFFSGDMLFYNLDGSTCLAAVPLTCALGQRRSYYSWEWGDALFVVLDPFWNQPIAPEQSGDWSLTLGRAQYDWLKSTLEKSGATYKFVFSHNLVGGINPNGLGPMRGGVEAAKYLEWGGYNLDGTWGFDKARPGWPMPIHQLLVANHVTAFLHGHDHLYAHQTLDGIAYQEGPQPSANNSNLGTRATDYGYLQGTTLGGRGYLRVQVAPSGVNVQYVETWVPSEEKGSIKNGMVADSYILTAAAVPSAIAGVANAASGNTTIAPNTWVSIYGSNLAPAGDSRNWGASDFVNNQMPAQLDGVSVTVNGKPAYVSYTSAAQVNVLTPPDALLGSVPIQVTVNGATSAPFTAQAQALSPAFFLFGGGHYVAALHANNAPVGPLSLYPGSSSPAKPGETVEIYATGFGSTSVPVTAGSALQSGILTSPPVFHIGGKAAAVQFAGLVMPGLFQFNVTVPPDATDGDQPIDATYNGAATQAGTLLTIQH